MYTKTITYKDYVGKEHTETLNFEISLSDIVDLFYNVGGDLLTKYDQIIESAGGMLWLVKTFLILGYGKLNKAKTQFNKSARIKNAFIQSKALDVVLFDLISDKTGEEVNKFMENIFSKDISNKIKEDGTKFDLEFNTKTIFDDLTNLGVKLKKDKGEK